MIAIDEVGVPIGTLRMRARVRSPAGRKLREWNVRIRSAVNICAFKNNAFAKQDIIATRTVLNNVKAPCDIAVFSSVLLEPALAASRKR